MDDIQIRDYGREKPPDDAEQTWTRDQVLAEFELVGFAAPFVVVRRRSDGVRGTLEFTHSPRVYFNFVRDES